jgi:integrase
MREPCYSNNPEVVECYRALMAHMPLVDRHSHIFLQPIPNPSSSIWFKQYVNVSKGVLSVIVASMAAKVGLVGDFTNKSCRSTSISRMIANGVPDDVIVTVTRHKNLKSLMRYDRTAIIRHISAQQASW